MNGRDSIGQQFDWTSAFLYLALVVSGLFTIHAAIYDPEVGQSIFDFNHNSGKQLIWIGFCLVLILMIILVDFKVFSSISTPLFFTSLLLLLTVLLIGREVSGSTSWFQLGPVRFQPSELAKLYS